MSKDKIHIIGGGIIGLSSAWYLQQAGFNVTVVDRTALSDGTSFGNAGMIVPSHFIPMASPGIIKKGLRWLMFPDSPFYIKPRLRVDLLQWLWQFYRSAKKEHVTRCAPLLLEFNAWSKHLYHELAQLDTFAGIGYAERGLLMLYQTAKQEQEEQELAAYAQKLGVAAEILSPKEVQQLEPEVALDVRGGLYFPSDAHLAPHLFMHRMQAALQAKGVQFITKQEITHFRTQNGLITEMCTASGDSIPVDQLLLTGGSWCNALLRQLGIPVLLQAGKGYSITIDTDQPRPSIPSILAEAKVAITPMAGQLRIGGTLELGPPDDRIDTRRLGGILDSLPRYYPQIDISSATQAPVWQGYRPCTPDGLPYIGRSTKWKNLSLATGHGMMGLSLGPATGKLISQILSGEKPTMAPDLFAPNRFGQF